MIWHSQEKFQKYIDKFGKVNYNHGIVKKKQEGKEVLP